ncbi:VOC family protein [Marivirga atlantica]|jgi:predicted enzyme related to lactoylglutathione lyase|uniref:VOC family protein n=1 Tax=Marivirga atlantica TaxID=1548457 RepID=A0A937DI35_9BACT|nr:VOC family protein [Marivirga atlantica]MBL0766578.1 VOC family protein [Marivirga atlantica]
MENAINWFEIPVQDFERAKKFYETLLQIELELFEIPNGPTMALFPVDENGSGIGGALVHYPRFYFSGEQGPLIYLNANPDLQKALDRVEASGGKHVLPKRMITEERGYMAVINDTEGNRIALHSNN